MQSPKRPTLPMLIISLAFLSGCAGGGESSPTSPPATSSAATVGGPPATCSKAALGKSVSAAGRAQGQTWVLDSVQCADGWAATTVTVEGKYDATELFEAEGQFWILKDRSKVCPKPSEVPQAIYKVGCETS